MINKILVAVDGSEASIEALDYAAEFSSENNAELTILSVIPTPPALAVEMYIPKYQEELEKNYVKLLNEQEERLKKKYLELKIVPIVRTGTPGKIIIDAAQTREVDLIIVGHRGQSGILTRMLGSVSRYVVENCSAPVLVVKNKEFCENI